MPEPDEDTAVQPARPQAPPPEPPPTLRGGGPPRGRGAWRAAAALIGVASIAVGVVEAVTAHSRKGHSTSTSTTTAPAPLGRATFIRRADAICADLNPEVEADYRIALADSNSGNIVGARSEIASLQVAAGRLVARIQALGPPAQGAEDVATILTEYQELVDAAVADTPESNASAVALQSEIAAQAAQFGFHVCGVT